MRGSKLNFSAAGAVFDFEQRVDDFDSTVQNALVNLVTDRGSDDVYADRGTDLMKDAVEGRMVTTSWAARAASIAATRTLAFSQSTEFGGPETRMQTFQMQIQEVKTQSVKIQVFTTSTAGESRGIQLTV